MKKTLLVFLLVGFSFSGYAQVELAPYNPVRYREGNSGGYSSNYGIGMDLPNPSTIQRNRQQFTEVAGYYYRKSTSYSSDNSGYKRTKVRVNESSQGGYGTQLWVRGVYHNNSYNAQWSNCNSRAEKVTALSDGQVLLDNFEWKVYDQFLGYIYFNY